MISAAKPQTFLASDVAIMSGGLLVCSQAVPLTGFASMEEAFSPQSTCVETTAGRLR